MNAKREREMNKQTPRQLLLLLAFRAVCVLLALFGHVSRRSLCHQPFLSRFSLYSPSISPLFYRLLLLLLLPPPDHHCGRVMFHSSSPRSLHFFHLVSFLVLFVTWALPSFILLLSPFLVHQIQQQDPTTTTTRNELNASAAAEGGTETEIGYERRDNYWWQGPQSPFSEGAAQNQGVVSGGRPGGQTVVGCSGDGCSSPLFSGPAVAASSSSSSSSGGGSCCNHYWQKPGHPCSTHQGNDCPRGFNCVNYRSCSNGVISHGANSGYASQKPSLDEVNFDSLLRVGMWE